MPQIFTKDTAILFQEATMAYESVTITEGTGKDVAVYTVDSKQMKE